MPVPAHAAGEENPIHNTVHDTQIIHPRIALEKTADRATASAGDTIGYRFDVTNPATSG